MTALGRGAWRKLGISAHQGLRIVTRCDPRRSYVNMRDLLNATLKTMQQAERINADLRDVKIDGLMQAVRVEALRHQLSEYVALTQRIVDQTQRRVLGGEQVPASEKIVSIFEPHTDIIIKDRREILYGHKVCLTSGASGLVTDVVVEHGNPADSALAVKMIKRQSELYGRAPRQVCFDGGFSSKANLEELKALGVQDVAFSKH